MGLYFRAVGISKIVRGRNHAGVEGHQASFASDTFVGDRRKDLASAIRTALRIRPRPKRCAVLWPHGVLFRNEEQSMRAKMVEQDWVEAVIGLGANLFYNSPMESCIVVCNRRKRTAHKGKVLFIDALNGFFGSLCEVVLIQAAAQR